MKHVILKNFATAKSAIEKYFKGEKLSDEEYRVLVSIRVFLEDNNDKLKQAWLGRN